MDNKKIPTYLGTIVIVIIAITAGMFVWQYEKNMPDDLAQSVTPTLVKKTLVQPVVAQPATDKTAELQTYQNKKYGFEFKYPRDWTVSEMMVEDGDWYASMKVTSPTEGHIWIAYYPTLLDVRNIKSSQSLEQHMLKNDEAETGLSYVKSFELLGQKWWFALEVGIASNDPTVFTENNGHVYQILFANFAEEDDSPDKMTGIEKEFLANFKFTK